MKEKPKSDRLEPLSMPLDVDTALRGAMAVGPPPDDKPKKKRKAKKGKRKKKAAP